MATKIELPPKYYLDHFRELRDVLTKQYSEFFLTSHSQFMNAFDALSEDAQCLYLRLMNRKGNFFFLDNLRYNEISDFEGSVCELRKGLFIRDPEESDWDKLVGFLPKQKLMELAIKKGIPFKRSWARDKAIEEMSSHNCAADLQGSLIIQLYQEELAYILFLYFGVIQENLSLYTLRDLGIRSVNERANFKARFSTKDEALSNFFYSRLVESEELLPPVETWPEAIGEKCSDLRESLLLRKAEEADELSRLEILKHCRSHPGREKYVRLLYQLQLREECRFHLEEMIENPYSDAELLFAEDFLERKFNQKRTSLLTDTLRSARKLTIDEAWFRSPEEGVIQLFKDQGVHALHVENYIWNTLFGLLFWEEINESEKTGLYNPFERFPAELYSSRFYELRQEDIDRKISSFRLEDLLLKVEAKKGIPNGIFGWHESIPEKLTLLLNHSERECIQRMLHHVAKNYASRSTGFPDLMCIEQDRVRFYEIKAEGDSLRQGQLIQILALRKAGFDVEVLQVKYAFNPEQVYVVVDLETTGGMLPYHRIIEIGAVKVKGGKIIDKFQTLVNPARRISFEIQQLTGITNEMVKDAPYFSEVADAFEEFSKDAIFVAHNVNFDYGFLQSEYERMERKFVRPFICTKQSMRKHYPGLESYSLKNLTSHFGIALETHHRALCDAEAATGLLFLINEKRAQNSPA